MDGKQADYGSGGRREPWWPWPQRGSRDSTQNCGARFGPDLDTQPPIRPATGCRTQHGIQSAVQGRNRREPGCRTQPRARSGAEGLSHCAVGCCINSDHHRATEMQANSLIHGHIQGRVVLGLEPRSQPGSDSPPAGANLRYSPGLSGRARSGSTRFLRDSRVRGQIVI